MHTSHKGNQCPSTFSRGFTIVELLIVIVVIGILAAITIVAYTGISQKAVASSLQSDLASASKKLKLYQIDNMAYPTALDCAATPAANTICLKASPGNTYSYSVVNNTNPQTFSLSAANTSNSIAYIVTDDTSPTVTAFNPIGQQAYTTAGIFTWTAPLYVTSVSVVAVGGGGSGGTTWSAGGGSGGGLGWKNGIAVTPGQSYTVVVGAGGLTSGTGLAGGDSYFINISTVKGGGGATNQGVGGTYTGDGGGNGGTGAQGSWSTPGGGAGGYTGNGGTGNSIAGNGGGGGTGCNYSSTWGNGGGGGVGILGQGANGVAGCSLGTGQGGGGGSGGANGDAGEPVTSGVSNRRYGGSYGGGGGGSGTSTSGYGGGTGGVGAVRIIWGAGRAFPSTSTSNL